MSDKPKEDRKLKCPIPKEHKEMVKEVAEVMEIHRDIARKITGIG